MSESTEEPGILAAAREEEGRAVAAMLVLLLVTHVALCAADIERSRVANRAFRLLGMTAVAFAA